MSHTGDAGADDAGSGDAAKDDAGTDDAGSGDAGTEDASTGDAGTEDAGPAPTCSDDVQNGNETAVDCGGGSYMGAPACPPCADGKTCKLGTDCSDGVCKGMPLTCQAPTCTDDVQNGNETDTDCGGAGYMGAAPCPRCGTGKNCGSSATNCVNLVCTGGVCQAPACTDGVKNGDETDIDCGGGSYMGLPACPPCNPGQKCGTGSDCVGGNCQTTCQCPTGMLVVPIQGGGVYCIDATEVTYSSYDVFYSANPTTANQTAGCSWNVGWTPAGAWPYTAQSSSQPVRYVNWCQAAAYCKYNGRRLCGQIGGGSVAPASFADYTKDQWFNACSAQNANTYPYGSAYVAVDCNGKDSVDGGSLGPGPATSWPNCTGGEPGLLDMSGNVAEWEDSCSATTGASDTCAVRGGSYEDSAALLLCGSNVTQPRDYTGNDVGFRCCL
jgi:hypothetical protein